MTLNEKIEKYRSSSDMTEREKAEIEREVWAAYLARDDRPRATAVTRRHYLKEILGVDAFSLDIRQALLCTGDDAKVLWDLLDEKKVPISVARYLLSEAKKIVGSGMSLPEAIDRAILIRDSRKSGRKVTREKPTRAAKTAESKLWSGIRKQVLDYLDHRTPNLDPIIKRKFYNETSVALQVVMDEFRLKLRRLVEAHDTTKKSSAMLSTMDEIDRACQMFGVETPKYGLPVDLERANKTKKAQARSLHPDLHGGDPKYVDQYHEVMSAYEVLEKYNAQLTAATEIRKNDHPGRNERRRHCAS